jgi:TPR repeat protein
MNEDMRSAIAQFEAGNFAAAYQAALPFAERGYRAAQFLVGNVLSTDALGRKDVLAARVWWERAASAGHFRAQFNLGYSYIDPHAEGNDPALAREWLTEAARCGHVEAMQQLGQLELREAGADQARAAQGYAWLRLACETGGTSARGVLGRALQASSWDDPARLEALLPEALHCTAPYRGTVGADLLHQADRGEAEAYYITSGLCYVAGQQGSSQNAFALNPTKPSQATLPAVARQLNRAFAEHQSLPAGTTNWVICRKGVSYPDVEVVALPHERLWDVVRPGDQVEISDGMNGHVTTAFSIDRDAGLIRFIDAWPEQFLLKPGLNALGIEARVEPYGRTRSLLCVARADFLASVRGLTGLAGVASMEALWHGIPELAGDGAAALALASTLAGMRDVECCARGLGWLIALLRGDGPALPEERVAAAADRAWLAGERLHGDAPDLHARCGMLGAAGRASKPGALLDELAQRWPPRFDTVSPHVLADVIWRRSASGDETTTSPERAWWRIWRRHQPADLLQRADLVGAEALAERALQRHPDNELLRLMRANVRMKRGDAGAAAKELADVVEVLDGKRRDPGPLVRDFDGIEVGADTGRIEIGRMEATALSLKAQALLMLRVPRDAVVALEQALELIGGDEPVLLAQLVHAASDAGETALADAAKSRLERANAQQWARRVQGALGTVLKT